MTLLDAVKAKNIEEVKRIIATGVDVNENHNSSFRWAYLMNYLEIMKLLVDNGANIYLDQEWLKRMTPARSPNHRVIRYLNKVMLLRKLNELN
jgi:ankyrin repeat protein